MRNKTCPQIDVYLDALSGRKVKNLSVLDVRGLTSMADFFILCSGRSSRQVAAIAEHAEKKLKKDSKIMPLTVEGKKEVRWALLDYGDVVIHIFFEEARTFYDLDGLWSDAKRIDTENRR